MSAYSTNSPVRLLEGTRGHFFRAAPVHHVHLLCAQEAALHGHIDGRHSTSDDDNCFADR
jgi:hypothetical protein